ncbi:hypothetical protein [Comamonas sp.]|uniref:hypothetical protein n=1 Tax=Comamonas sp. TaxID=34028 RepID=UPI00289AA190|nr:hypothetical protein [Comamonas sp.]
MNCDTSVIVDMQPGEILVMPEDSQVIVTEIELTEVLIAPGEQGPPGPPGPAGGGGDEYVTRTAGETISANRVLYDRAGLVYPLGQADAENIYAILGLSVSAGQVGAQISVQRSGTVTDSGWSWAYGRVYLGANGQLTQTPPSSGFSVLIGFAATATSINLSINDPIEV